MTGGRVLPGIVIALSCAMSWPGLAASDAPKVVVTLKPVHALVSAIMEGVGTPVLLVDGAQSPHTFALKPSGARAMAQADVFIRVSPAIEAFTLKASEALPPSVTMLTLADAPGVQVLKQRQGALFEAHDHHHDDGDHDHGGDEHAAIDAHIWLDPENAIAIVAAVTKALVARYPESAERFKSNASALDAKIAALESDLTTELAPLKGKSFIVFHDAYHYFENRFGLQAVGSITLSPEVQPSAKRLTEVRQKVAGLGAVCVFAEPGFQPALISAVTEGTKAKAGTLDPEGVALQPGSDLYFDLMHNLAQSLVSCLSPGQ